ncbi:MAG: tyrosine-type recombinase/integrase [Deltaproteobacteria bacterium]|nr:tyrosine-type recombinase/integrase [Deltaproteobacteria bacterium]
MTDWFCTLFCHEDGKPLKSVQCGLKRLFRKLGFHGVSPHSLRMTFCSLLARQKVHPKVAQQLLGHSDVRLTMDIYTEVDDRQKIAAVQSLPTCRELVEQKFVSELKSA